MDITPIGGRQWQNFGYLDCLHAVVVDAEPRLPHTVDFFCIEHLHLLNELIEHPGGQLSCTGVFANQVDEHIRAHRPAALFLDFGAEFFIFSASTFCSSSYRRNIFANRYEESLAESIAFIVASPLSCFEESCLQFHCFLRMLFPMITIPASISATDRPIKRPETKSFTSEPLIVAAIALQAIPRRIRITPYYDSILSAPNAVSVTTIAKDYGMSAKALNEFLHQLGTQYKRGAARMFRPFAP